jgi:2,3,4,5-tetrahydropyridine-2,6-dicarboxylate N-acetyltransferase
MNDFLNNPYEIAKFIKDAKKTTPVKLYLNGDLKAIDFSRGHYFGSHSSGVFFAELEVVKTLLEQHRDSIKDYMLEVDRRLSAIPLLDITQVQARIEPGSVIREFVTIGRNAVIMMGAVINIGASIGEETMIDMNAVVGARAIIGKKCHIGAGAVVAGVLEPPSATPVIIKDHVLVGANAVILEGVKLGENSVVAAGAVVTEDVPPNAVVAGMPAKVIKFKDDKTKKKTEILDDLRK